MGSHDVAEGKADQARPIAMYFGGDWAEKGGS